MSTVPTAPQYHLELIDGREVEKPLLEKLRAIGQARLLA